jgi:hypothetical protein
MLGFVSFGFFYMVTPLAVCRNFSLQYGRQEVANKAVLMIFDMYVLMLNCCSHIVWDRHIIKAGERDIAT